MIMMIKKNKIVINIFSIIVMLMMITKILVKLTNNFYDLCMMKIDLLEE